jgi:hypothetical protein
LSQPWNFHYFEPVRYFCCRPVATLWHNRLVAYNQFRCRCRCFVKKRNSAPATPVALACHGDIDVGYG